MFLRGLAKLSMNPKPSFHPVSGVVYSEIEEKPKFHPVLGFNKPSD